MSLGSIIARKQPTHAKPRMTSQQIADLMLQQDWERRQAVRRGDIARASECAAELDQLERLLA